MRNLIGFCLVALVFLGPGQTSEAHEDGDIVIVATDIHDTALGCRVTFRLINRSYRYLQIGRFHVIASDGNIERFILRNGDRDNRELFYGTPCPAVFDGLRLTLARCNYRGVLGFRDCRDRARLVLD